MTGCVPDERVAAATKAWAARCVANGVDPNDYERTTRSIEAWSGWLDAWVALGRLHEDRADEAETKARHRTAGEAHVRAAIAYHFAKFAWLEDLPKVAAVTERSVAALRRGLGRLDPTFERLEIPFERDRLAANLRRPATAFRASAVVLVPGLDSTKEEFTSWEDVFLARGLATISLDGPGQGEAGRLNALRPDYEVPVTALLDALGPRPELDPRRIGIAGIGLGGYYAMRAAAYEPRLRAAAMVGAPYRLVLRSLGTLQKFMHDARIADEADAHAHAARFTLEGVTQRVAQPSLVVHGERDPIMPWRDAARAASELPRGELLLYPDGGTACSTVAFRARADLADWMRERLYAAWAG